MEAFFGLQLPLLDSWVGQPLVSRGCQRVRQKRGAGMWWDSLWALKGRIGRAGHPFPLPRVSTRMPGPLPQPFPFGKQELTLTLLCSQSICPTPSSEFSLPPRNTHWQLWLAPSATAVSPPLFSPCMNEKASIFAPRDAAGRSSKAAALQTISLYTRPKCKVSGAGEVPGKRARGPWVFRRPRQSPVPSPRGSGGHCVQHLLSSP